MLLNCRINKYVYVGLSICVINVEEALHSLKVPIINGVCFDLVCMDVWVSTCFNVHIHVWHTDVATASRWSPHSCMVDLLLSQVLWQLWQLSDRQSPVYPAGQEIHPSIPHFLAEDGTLGQAVRYLWIHFGQLGLELQNQLWLLSMKLRRTQVVYIHPWWLALSYPFSPPAQFKKWNENEQRHPNCNSYWPQPWHVEHSCALSWHTYM